ncbi:sigma-70 family RNA polymerase sigma factor [Paenibacillus farraposensis]|uniref:Sigma-70 family RNA polymerase sigma factor n=1 Tax=Paenibacillus farraposensis TaxID=2807095 RepID=A0ABW4D7R2_9BACL|nr:sigma-70 family RNA polymerase sigma factor [Paenibacillus farraposensis]MCC3379052.1 sigma-70 family RNA polymerase sigma factor [Paenibacillus farraposensis]
MIGKEHGIEQESVALSLEELYQKYRKYSFAIAYRMLGTVTDAEDVVQDCFVELKNKPLNDIQNPKAYVAKMTMNRCLNLLNSARKQRETYVGQWLPEPLGESADLPADWLERKDMISYAFLVLLEQLKPTERAVFVLREAFQYDYKDIAELLGKTESNCRQLFSRSRRILASGESDAAAPTGNPENNASRVKLLERFTAAFLAYDVTAMLELLAEQPIFVADGGGNVHTVMRPMVVRKGVLALLTSRRVLTALRERELVHTVINGEVQLAFLREGKVKEALCIRLTPDGEQIQDFYLMINPDKLGHIRLSQEEAHKQ